VGPTVDMSAPVERFLESHPDAARAWYPFAARAVGALLRVPGLDRWLPLARRFDAVAQPAGSATVRAQPRDSRPAGPPQGAGREITVLSANLWHDWPRQHRWTERLEAVAQLVEAESVDILLLQEVARTRSLHADAWLADRLGMAVAYARGNGAVDAIGFEEGLAVLSRFPLVEVHLRELSRSPNPLVRRIALGADVDTPHGRVLAVSVHLGLAHRHNSQQLRSLRSWVSDVSRREVAIVGGDLNAPEGRSEISRTKSAWTDAFRHIHADADASTHEGSSRWSRRHGPRRLDYVFVQQPLDRHWHVTDASHLDAPGGRHSDHRAVLARVIPG
jgi:endonuclease/exonuclease/phosphatase family metal-dependent hydrolase